MAQSQLAAQGHFLTLSRQQPSLFNQPLSFTLANGTEVDILAAGVIIFTPAEAGKKDIILSCGVHGNETAPIEICDEFVQQILTGQVALAHRVMFLFGNLPAMNIGQRFVEENMNRLFSGAHSEPPGCNNEERKRAKLLEEAVTYFYRPTNTGASRQRYHYDLHTAIRASKNEKFAVYPFLHGRAHSREQVQFLGQCGVRTILLSDAPTTTFSYFSSHTFGAHAFTVELGKVRPFGENDMRRFAEAKDMFSNLITQPELQLGEFDEQAFDIYRVNQTINRTQDDFKLHFSDDTPNFTDYPKGTLLASETDHTYRAEVDGEAIVFPNAKVARGQRALLTVVPASLD